MLNYMATTALAGAAVLVMVASASANDKAIYQDNYYNRVSDRHVVSIESMPDNGLIALQGYVEDKQDNRNFTLVDSSGDIDVRLMEPAPELQEGHLIRVEGYVSEGGYFVDNSINKASIEPPVTSGQTSVEDAELKPYLGDSSVDRQYIDGDTYDDGGDATDNSGYEY